MNELQNFEYLKFQYEKETLHDVFGTVLDTFPHITGATLTGQIYLWDVLQRIKYNLVSDIEPETYLLHKYLNSIRNKAYDQRKEQLPAICYNARFNGYKDTEHLSSITNLMFLDIDDFPTKEKALEYKQEIITKYDWIIACNLSLSKIGLHIVALVDRIMDNDDFNNKYDFISSTYFDGLLDKTSKSLTRYTVLPSDYNIYINESPSILEIDKIINEHKKGIRSAHIQGGNLTPTSLNEKGISSVHNIYNQSLIGNDNEKGIRSAHKEGEIIYTPYTFFSNSPLNQLMNDAARNYKLRFKQEVDELYFQDPNIPIYFREGIDVIEVRLFHLREKKILEGNRHNFIGALTLKMIYLNVGSPNNNDPIIRRDILKFILHINKTICAPPLTYNEVLKSYNANWKRYINGDIDFSRYCIKQRSFWSKCSTLTPNEKRKVTCKIKNEPIVQETKRKIYEGIEKIMVNCEKITQKKVSNYSGVGLSTVKKYWKEFKDFVKTNNMNNNQPLKEIELTKQLPDLKTNPEFEVLGNKSIPEDMQSGHEDLENTGIDDLEEEIFSMDMLSKDDSKPVITPERIHKAFERIFGTHNKSLAEDDTPELYDRLVALFNAFSEDDKQLLVKPVEEIFDSTTFFRQSTLESKFWELRNKMLHGERIYAEKAEKD